MTTRTIRNIQVVLVNGECPCGGSVMDAVTGSFDLTLGDAMVCDTCEAAIVVGNRTTAKLATNK